MTSKQWTAGRKAAGMTQAGAARRLKVTQPYLSQLETGVRTASRKLEHRAAEVYRLATAIPLRRTPRAFTASELERKLASLDYPGFAHVPSGAPVNPAEVVLSAALTENLDTRLVEAVPWILNTYPDLNWEWLLNHARLNNAQNRLGYFVHLAAEAARAMPQREKAASALPQREMEIEKARLAGEGTLCRDGMPEPERAWLRLHRSEAAAHWNLLTGLTVDQLPYVSL